MFITTKYLAETFKKYNAMYFNNELPTPTFKVGRGVRRLGCFTYRKINGRFETMQITVSQYNGLRTQKDIDKTLIHEMIHLWQRVNGYSDVHGNSFKRKAQMIKVASNGEIDITRLSKGVELENNAGPHNIPTIKQPKNITVFAARHKSSNDYWLFGTANTSTAFYEINSILRRNSHIWENLGCWETKDPDLLKLNRCRSRLCGRRFTEQEFIKFVNEKNIYFLIKKFAR